MLTNIRLFVVHSLTGLAQLPVLLNLYKLDASMEGRLRFYDGSFLKFDEAVFFQGRQIIKLHYVYHYQDSDGNLVFRYDNAPHHPHISTYPHHKYIGTDIESAQVPDLSEILREIERLIYSAD